MLEYDFILWYVVFVLVMCGYKVGGINVDVCIDLVVDLLSYEMEYLWMYEVGVCGSWLEQWLMGEVMFFDIEWEDMQVCDLVGFGGSYCFFMDNVESVSVCGFEVVSCFVLMLQWLVSGLFVLMDLQFDMFVLFNGLFVGDCCFVNILKYGYMFGMCYQVEQGFFGSVELVGWVCFYDLNNYDEEWWVFNVVNVSFGYVWWEWMFMVWVCNVFDKEYDWCVFFFGNEDLNYDMMWYELCVDLCQVGVMVMYWF